MLRYMETANSFFNALILMAIKNNGMGNASQGPKGHFQVALFRECRAGLMLNLTFAIHDLRKI